MGIICRNARIMKTVLVVVLLAAVAAPFCDAQCFLDMQCVSEGVEHKDGEKWTTSDCFECSCFATGNTEVLASCYEYTLIGNLFEETQVRKVEYKSDFTS